MYRINGGGIIELGTRFYIGAVLLLLGVVSLFTSTVQYFITNGVYGALFGLGLYFAIGISLVYDGVNRPRERLERRREMEQDSEVVKRCDNCGETVDLDADYCPECGDSLN